MEQAVQLPGNANQYRIDEQKKQLGTTMCMVNSAILAVSGGLQDIYTYRLRGEVFANAQTGNVIFMSENLMNGNFLQALYYLIPLLAFTFGILVTEEIHRHAENRRINWKQEVVILEMLILFLVGFIPFSWNMLANALVSFTCAMQVQTFRKMSGNGYAYATTMCIGNLRSGIDALSSYLHEPTSEKRTQILFYLSIILLFAFGAGLGSFLCRQIGVQTIWCSSLLLGASFVLMSVRTRVCMSKSLNQ